jgi:type I site-specific restriction-modification system R (restriction) subunit
VFKKYYQFGFTGTPIFPQNALGAETTGSVFGRELHSYVITDAIRDEKVLKFKVNFFLRFFCASPNWLRCASSKIKTTCLL